MANEAISQLENLGETGVPPKSRVTGVEQARAIAVKAIDADEKRSAVRARVKGLVDGNPPYKASDLTKAGQSNRCNTNFREAESFLNNALAAFYDIFSEAPTYSDVMFDTGSPEDDARWTREATKCFQWLNEQDTELDYGVQLSQHDLVLYGCGPHVWENEWDYRSVPLRCGQLKLPNRSSSNVCKWEELTVVVEYSPAQLYGFIKDPEYAEQRGWNVSETRKAIMRAAPQSFVQTKRGDTWEEVQQHLRNNDLFWHECGEVIRTHHLFWREFPNADEEYGAISHAIFTPDDNFGFLFFKVAQYEDWKNVVCPFYYDKGDGTHHSVKGLGIKMYGALELLNRYSNAVYDAGMGVMTTMLQATTPEAVQKMSQVTLGPWTILPPELNYVQRNVNGVLDAPLAIKRELISTVSSNLSMYRQGLDQKEGNPITAREAAIRFETQNSLNKTQITRYYEQLDDFWGERWRRAIDPACYREEAKQFRKKLKDYGIPADKLKKAKVRAVRVIGQGSALQRRTTLTEMLGISGVLPEAGRQNLIDAWIAASTGQQFVELFNPKAAGQITRDEWEANEENATMRVGAQPKWTPYQNNVVHAQSHLAAAATALQSLQPQPQGGPTANPSEVLGFLDIAGPHIAVHLQQMAQDPTKKDAYKALNGQWKQMASATDKLRGVVQQQISDQAQAQSQRRQMMDEMMSEENLNMMRTMRDERRKDALTQSEIARKTSKAQVDNAAKIAKTQAGIQTDRMKAVAAASQPKRNGT